MIDWDRVIELRDEIGSDMFDEVVALFLEEMRDGISALSGIGDDPGQWSERLHFLKGAALNLGFADLSALCATGERQAAAGSMPDVTAEQVASCFDASQQAFDAERTARLAA